MNDIEHIKKLQSYYAEHGVLPSYSVIAKIVGYKSKNSVFNLIERLKLSGRIALTPENKIKPGINFLDGIKR